MGGMSGDMRRAFRAGREIEVAREAAAQAHIGAQRRAIQAAREALSRPDRDAVLDRVHLETLADLAEAVLARL